MKLLSRFGAALLIVPIVWPCAAFAQSQLNYTTSWIGNTFGFGNGTWVQQDIQSIGVAPNGNGVYEFAVGRER